MCRKLTPPRLPTETGARWESLDHSPHAHDSTDFTSFVHASQCCNRIDVCQRLPSA